MGWDGLGLHGRVRQMRCTYFHVWRFIGVGFFLLFCLDGGSLFVYLWVLMSPLKGGRAGLGGKGKEREGKERYMYGFIGT